MQRAPSLPPERTAQLVLDVGTAQRKIAAIYVMHTQDKLRHFGMMLARCPHLHSNPFKGLQ
jgi:hypothetical protein